VSTTFRDLGIPADIADDLALRGFAEPYPIQVATIADSLAGHDVCAQAPTGSGKTLAFGIPLVVRTSQARPRRPKALVLAPTRELAAQIADELSSLGRTRDCRVATFYGGVGFGKQLEALKRGVDIAVACPGRLLDLFEQGAIRLSDVETVVIDEADRMADMGFMPVVRTILAEVREQHQTLLYSATLQGDVHRLIKDYQVNPRRHVLDAPADAMGSRTHAFWRVDRSQRTNLAAGIVLAHGSTIVFCRTKHGAERLANQLSQVGVAAVTIHGDRSQAQRDRALALFQAGKAQVLVGTDVAARGIHVDDVACVVHYDPPEDENTYIHRSGRTGRAGTNGRVISLISSDQESITKKMQRQLGLPLGFEMPEQHLPAPSGEPHQMERAESPSQRRNPSSRSFSRHRGGSDRERTATQGGRSTAGGYHGSRSGAPAQGTRSTSGNQGGRPAGTRAARPKNSTRNGRGPKRAA
jgi:superfamily II DNA/RNA helicase